MKHDFETGNKKLMDRWFRDFVRDTRKRMVMHKVLKDSKEEAGTRGAKIALGCRRLNP